MNRSDAQYLRLPLFLVAALFGLCCTGPCLALMTAARPNVVNPSAGSDDPHAPGSEFGVATAGANGTFVGIYSSTDSLNGTIGSDRDILAVRSVDAGRTWSSPVAVDSGAAEDDTSELVGGIATNGQGLWLAVWESPLYAARSLDNGQSWSTRTRISDQGYDADVAASGTVAVAVWDAENVPGYGNDNDVFYARSSDGGVSWTTPALLDPEGVSLDGYDRHARVTTDGASNWVAVWQELFQVRAVRSTDDGLTWGTSVVVGPTGDSMGGAVVDVGTDKNGHWIAVWEAYETGGILGIAGADSDLAYSVSSDAGLTWSPAKALVDDEATDGAYEGRPRVEADANGDFQVVWYQSLDTFGGTVGNDADIFGSRSFDGGEHWTPRSLVNANGNRDIPSGDAVSRDSSAEVASDRAGNWVVAWMSTDSLEQTIGEDWDVLSSASHDDCSAVPRNDCATSPARGSRLTVKNGTGGRDRLLWTWSGAGTVAADLGNPTTGDGYALCLYDKIGADLRTVFEMDALGAVTCNMSGSPCWSATATGFRYKDSLNLNGAAKNVTVAAMPEEKGKFRLIGAGPTLSLPTLPLAVSPQVQVQFINTGTGACWAATYSTAVRNDTGWFKAVSD